MPFIIPEAEERGKNGRDDVAWTLGRKYVSWWPLLHWGTACRAACAQATAPEPHASHGHEPVHKAGAPVPRVPLCIGGGEGLVGMGVFQ